MRSNPCRQERSVRWGDLIPYSSNIKCPGNALTSPGPAHHMVPAGHIVYSCG